MSISELSIKRPTFVVVIFAVLAILGAISYSTLRYEMMPSFDFPVFIVATVYPGAAPSEVENSVTKVMEGTLSSVQGVDNLRGISRENVSLVIVMLKQGTNTDVALNDGSRLASSAKTSLPDEVYDPMVIKINLNAMAVLNLAVRADNISATELYDLLNYRIIPEFSSISGVGEVSIMAASQREIQVNVDPAKLQAQNLSLLQVVNTVKTNNMSFPVGNIKTVEVMIKDPSVEKGDLRPDLAGSVSFDLPPMQNVLAIPRETLVNGVKDPKVYVVENGKAVLKKIALELVEGSNAVLRENVLNVGERVVLTGHQNLYEGAAVRIIQ
ncbi:acriflavin resistance protein [Fibrobacteria bacterium R8-3-H12]